jgi:hypothetical protein
MFQVLHIDEPFRRGLGSEERGSLNAPALERCYGARPTPAGLIYERGVTWPLATGSANFDYNKTDSDPVYHSHYPMFFRGKSKTLYVSATPAVYETTTSAWKWTLPAALTFPTTVTPHGGRWDFLDFGTNWVLANDAQALWLSGGTYGRKTNSVRVATHHLGRVLWNNPYAWAASGHAGHLDTGAMELFWRNSLAHTHSEGDTTLTHTHPEGGTTLAHTPAAMSFAMSSGNNTVFWSSIGNADLMWRQLFSSDSDDLSLWKRNDCGFMTLPEQGRIQCLLPLGRNVIAYTTEGVYALMMNQLTYGLQQIAPMGIPCRGCACGDDRGHTFLDSGGTLWRLLPSLDLVRVGFERHFLTDEVLDYETLLTLAPNSRDVYIANSVTGYMLNANNLLAESRIKPTSLLWHEGGLCGNATLSTGDATIQTSYYDLKTREPKIIHGIELGSRTPENYHVTVKCQNRGGTETDHRFDVGPCDVRSNGYVAVQATAVELAIEITCASTVADIDIDWVNVHYVVGQRLSGAAL